MLEIDGEFFDDPVEKAKAKKAFLISSYITTHCLEYTSVLQSLMTAPLFPNQYKGEEVTTKCNQ